MDNYVRFNGEQVVFEEEVVFNKGLDGGGVDKFSEFGKEEGYGVVYVDHEEMRA